ncbi:MAG TPA: hypothetical protein VFL27_05105 [Candidatus Dormibacteraeota bacterium]|nr:hypothetical protein [Candidatus Dormibacteraeota bacterium]
MSSLQAVVSELRWADVRTSAVRYLIHGAVAAVAWVFVVLLAARLLPVEQTLRVAELGVPVVFAAVVIAWAAARPSQAKLMQTADLRLALKERLSTAWERRGADGPMDAALRRDALEHAARIQLSRAYPVGVRRQEFALTAALLVAAFALLVLPNPMDQVIAQRHADQAAQKRAANAITATQKRLSTGPAPAAVDPQVQQILQDAKAKIAAAPDPRTALQNITPAEQQLLQLSDPGTAARASTAQNLANALASTNAGRAASQALNASPSQGAQSLRQVASSLQSLSPQDRAQLAQALQQAAQQAKDPQMQASLRQAASALQSGDLVAAAAALDGVASELDSLQQQETNDQEIAAAINGLEAARQQLANQADADSRAQSSSQAQGSGSPGSGAGNGTGTGNNPGSGTGNGNGPGTGNGGSGSGGTGGHGSSGSGAGSGTAAASTEKVYVPAPPVPGQVENDPTPLGPGQDVPLTPYDQVIQAYQQVALDATDQSLIPGSESDLIRQYFSSLGESGGGQ